MDLHQKIRTLPTSPGVYLYKNAEGEIIYVGKANNLRARVRSSVPQFAPHSIQRVTRNRRGQVNGHVKRLVTAMNVPDDQAGFAGGFAVDHDLGRVYAVNLGKAAKAYGYPGNGRVGINKYCLTTSTERSFVES